MSSDIPTDSQAPAEDASARVKRLSSRLGYNANAITVALLAELQVPPLANQVLFPLVTDRVHHLLRQITREEAAATQKAGLEARRSRAGGTGTPHSQAGATPDLSGPLAFLDFKVLMPGAPQGYKLYRYLTSHEHDQRRRIHMKNAQPALHSARSHAWAAEQCQKHEAACLDEIDQELLAKELPEEGIRT